MSTPSQPLCIGMINICIQINRDITLNPDNSHLASWIILWHNKHNIFVYLPNHQNAIGSLPGTLSKTLIPFLGAPQTFMYCGPGGAWIENFQSNPTQTLFVEGVFLTDANYPSSAQKPNIALMFFTWYPNILFIIESFQTQDFKLKMTKEYDCNTHSQCQVFAPIFPASNSTPASYPAVLSWTYKQKLIQLPSVSDLPMMTPPHCIIQIPLLPHQKSGLAFLWDQEMPNGQSARTLWATSPPGSTFNAKHIITNKVASSFESLLTNTPLGGLLADYMGLGKTIQAISLIGTSKEQLIENPHFSMPTMIICPPCLITNWQSEISKHAQAGALHAKIYTGPTHPSLYEANILKYDILITSYNTITQEFKRTHSSTSFIFKINWNCIILDEAHYIHSQYTATHPAINSLLSSHQIGLTGTPIHNTIYDLLGIISFITQPQSSYQDNWSPFLLSSLSKGCNDILHLALRNLSLHRTKTTHLESLPTVSHHYELLPLNPTMQQECSTLYKEFLSSKRQGPGEFFRNINKLQICCNHHIMLNTIADADLEDHGGRSTQDNSSTITQTIVDVETCMISSKTAHLLQILMKNKQKKCGPTKLVVYTQWTHFLDLIGIALAHHSILSAQIDGIITARAQEKALENFFKNTECEVLIASIAAAGTGLNIACATIVYLMVRGPPKFYADFQTLTSTFPGAQLEPSH
ncbi:hypothetical protein O181_026219 [Austropuccinia psidii MF-1]|uniref:Helicase ATP-binding domain-containing protein n=1 Tax=Austropuccinia psidii MF-1 TaxID=1389203 RepID=A0A9Q3H1E7_9BASI|nr:hypothetical protein [Austropuccinia psidii MF-1]